MYKSFALMFGLLLCLGCSISVIAQSTDAAAPAGPARTHSPGWAEFTSAEGGFKVLFPTVPKHSTEEVRVGTQLVKGHIFTSKAAATFSLMYFDAPVAPGALISVKDLLNGLRNYALAQSPGRLLFDVEISFGGNPGRLLKLILTDKRVARIMLCVAGPRLYRAMATYDSKVSDLEAGLVTSSDYFETFQLLTDGASADGEVAALLRREGELGKPDTPKEVYESSTPVLNGRAIRLVRPAYPPIARAGHACGQVSVLVTLDEQGVPIAAHATSGAELLRAVSEQAGKASRFSPTLLAGVPVKVTGTIIFNFPCG